MLSPQCGLITALSRRVSPLASITCLCPASLNMAPLALPDLPRVYLQLHFLPTRTPVRAQERAEFPTLGAPPTSFASSRLLASPSVSLPPRPVRPYGSPGGIVVPSRPGSRTGRGTV